MTLESGHTFAQWSQLSDEEKKKNRSLTNYAFTYCIENPDTLLSYKEMNRAGLSHIYSFFINEFNDNSSGKIEYNDEGIIYRSEVRLDG